MLDRYCYNNMINLQLAKSCLELFLTPGHIVLLQPKVIKSTINFNEYAKYSIYSCLPHFRVNLVLNIFSSKLAQPFLDI